VDPETILDQAAAATPLPLGASCDVQAAGTAAAEQCELTVDVITSPAPAPSPPLAQGAAPHYSFSVGMITTSAMGALTQGSTTAAIRMPAGSSETAGGVTIAARSSAENVGMTDGSVQILHEAQDFSSGGINTSVVGSTNVGVNSVTIEN
jgi:hypothetical protein